MPEPNTLSLCIIARDEARFLERCLESAKDRVDQIVVVDTGSSDDTLDVARKAGAIVAEFEWIDDFSAARNCSLDIATGDWILVLDCDEVVSPLGWTRLHEVIASQRADAYRITTRNYSQKSDRVGWQANSGDYAEEEGAYAGWFPTTKIRLFRNHPDVRFEGALHELVERRAESAGWQVEDCSIPVHHYGYVAKERQASTYAKLAEQKAETDPVDVMAKYELALAYRDCERYEEARQAMKACIALLESGSTGAYLQPALVHLVAGEIEGKLGDRQSELAAYERALSVEPGSFQAMNNLGTALMRRGDLDAALDLYTRANTIAPNTPTIQENIRRVKRRMDDREQGADNLEGGRLTLCMIAKNEEERLGRCLESVQGLVDEIVVVDTGSDDRTVEIAESYGATLGYFPWKNNWSEARNESLKLATGDWIMWLDPDDLLPPEMFCKIREAMKRGLGKKKAYFWILDDQGYEPVNCLQMRLFPNIEGVEFRQPIHEQLTPSLAELGVTCEPTNIRVIHTGYTTPEVVRDKQERYLAIMQDWLKTHPEDYIVRTHAAQTLYIHGRLDEAISYYHQIIDDSACVADHNLIIETMARLFLGRCYMRQEEYELALDNLLKARELDDEYALTNLTLGECYTRMGRHDEALEVLGLAKTHEGKVTFSATDPIATRFSIRYAIGENLEAKGLLDQALSAYKEAAASDPNRSTALGAMSTVYRKSGNRDEATACLDKALEMDPDNLQHAFNRGTFYLEDGEEDKARALFEQVVEGDVDLYEPYLNLGYLARRCGKAVVAEAYYRKAATYEAGRFDANCNLGHLLLAEARYQDAYTAFTEARAIRDEVLDVNLGQCVAACGTDRIAEAVDPFKAVLAALYNPQLAKSLPDELTVKGMSQLLSESGRMLIEKNLIACSLLAFLGAYLLEPDSLHYGLQLAELYRTASEPWKAVQVYEEQIKAYPTEPELFRKLREVYVDLGAQEAVQLCDEHLAQLSGGRGSSVQQAC
ncbi:glycosyltransferase [bacterium]|nr:glycosyltransferase [bacterium]